MAGVLDDASSTTPLQPPSSAPVECGTQTTEMLIGKPQQKSKKQKQRCSDDDDETPVAPSDIEVDDAVRHTGFFKKPNTDNPTLTTFTFRESFNPDFFSVIRTIINHETIYDEESTFTAVDLYDYLPVINAQIDEGRIVLVPFALALTEIYKDNLRRMSEMIKDGRISFNNLTKLLAPGTKFVTTVADGRTFSGSKVVTSAVHADQFGNKFLYVDGLFILAKNTQFQAVSQRFILRGFKGLKMISSLSIRPMTPEDEDFLRKRGQQFVKYGKGIQHIYYTGAYSYLTSYGYQVYGDGTGRAMIDALGHNRSHECYGDESRGQPHQFETVPEDLLYTTWHVVEGYSLSKKNWGSFFVDYISDITFDDKAFEYLVLDEQVKRTIRALIIHAPKTANNDLISGKSNNCIFLLHGATGTGKTLTCEAVAEFLHRPLYAVTMGELTINTESLETKFQQILETAQRWGAVILFDECEVLLETRRDGKLEQNAIVGVILRDLERYNNIIFMTTNRKDSIDDAIKSRITAFLEYPSLSLATRVQIWKNLMKFSKINVTDEIIHAIQHHEVNGRQIKNILRVAQCLAIEHGTSVNLEHLKMALHIGNVS